MTNPDTIGAEIARAREARGWSPQQLAKRLGTSKANVSRWESDTHVPKLEQIGPISRLLEIPLTKLTALAERARSARSMPSSPDGSRQPMPNWVEDLVDMSTETDELREAWEKVHRLWVMSRKPRADMSKENWRHLLKQTRSLMFEAEAVDFPSRKPPKGRRDKAAGEED